MNARILVSLSLAVLAGSPYAGAQEPQDASAQRIDDWMVPIHSHPADPVGGAYGTWAAGPDYKVSFDDGFTFYPVLGESYPRNLPLRWRTESVRAGEQALVDRGTVARRHATAWRYELRYGSVTEAYDVRDDGIEQTFTIHTPPQGGGDVVVRGRIATELQSRDAASDHQELVFRDASDATVVSYGKAFAFDGDGRRTLVTTSLEGDTVTLRLAASWLVDAAYPVTIDPIVGNAVIPSVGSPNNGIPSYPSIARDDVYNDMAVSYSRASSASDYDTWVRPVDDSMTTLGLFFTDITATWSTRHTSVAFVWSSSRWVVAIGREFASESRVRVYVHQANNFVPNSGSIMYLAGPGGFQDQHPSIGGNPFGVGDSTAYLAFRRDAGIGQPNTSNSQVLGVVVDALTETFGTVQNLNSGRSDNEEPCVTHSREGTNNSWVVAWQTHDNTRGDDWDIAVSLVDANGGLTGPAYVGDESVASRHKLHPSVDGRHGRFAVSYLMHDNSSPASSLTGDQIRIQRFDWFDGQPSPTTQPSQIVADSGGMGNTFRASLNRAIAYDWNTESHWTVVYRNTANDIYAARCGYSGRVVEHALVFAHFSIAGISPTVCFNDDTREFAIAYGTTEAPENPLYGKRLQYYATAANVRYGSSCAGMATANNRGTSNDPFAGSQFYSLSLSGGRPSAPTLLLLSGGSASFPLPSSAGGCELLLDPTTMVVVTSGASDAAGDFSAGVPLLDTVTNANLFWQFLQLDGGLLWSSTGLESRIR